MISVPSISGTVCITAAICSASEACNSCAVATIGRRPPARLPAPWGTYLCAHDAAAPDYLSRFGAHGWPLQRHRSGLTIHDPLRQASGGALPLGQATAALSGKCWQSLELRARRGVESSLPADAPKAPWLEENLLPGWRRQPENLGPSWLAGSWIAHAIQPHCSRDTGARDMERERVRLLIRNQ